MHVQITAATPDVAAMRCMQLLITLKQMLLPPGSRIFIPSSWIRVSHHLHHPNKWVGSGL